jgi:hypothetical protein
MEGGSILTSFRNIISIKTPTAVTQKAQQFPLTSAQLLMAE